jgi:orotate phosphoribosyltransferase
MDAAAASGLAAPRQRLLELLRELAFAEREVVLSSGLRSNFYIDCKKVSLDGEGAFLVGQLLYATIRQTCPEVSAVGGLTLGADPLATAASMVSFVAGQPLTAFIVRKEPKGHGTGQWIESGGRLRAGAAVAIVEDVVTTGAATLTAIDRARASGLRVVRAIALVDRLEGGRERVEAHCPLTTLFDRKDFLP